LFHVFEIIVYQLDDDSRFDFAEACAKEAVYAREALLGLQHPRVQLLRQRLVAFLLRRGQVDEARDLLLGRAMREPTGGAPV
jgi:hypothetical protein